jgi:hypothetical protein
VGGAPGIVCKEKDLSGEDIKKPELFLIEEEIEDQEINLI